jgi:S1-C subfamily serine protease
MRTNDATFWIGRVGAIVLVTTAQIATTAAPIPEIAKTAKAITVIVTAPGSQGSGTLVHRQGDTYTVLTAAHVVRNRNVSYKISTSDGKEYEIVKNSIRAATGDLDLAVVKFRASGTYAIAKLGNCSQLTEGVELYVSGYPASTRTITKPVFVFREGRVSANSTKIFDRGYSLVYSNDTLPGMSGGAVLNTAGELVAIHGEGDREQTSDGELGNKTGFNLGIPIERFIAIASSLQTEIPQRDVPKPALQTANTAAKPSDYLMLGIQKYRKGDKNGALTDFNRAIAIDVSYVAAYRYRGLLKDRKLNDARGALADLDRAIQLKPNYFTALTDRAYLRDRKFNDRQGALGDYNRALAIDPQYTQAYLLRGLLVQRKFNNPQAALADFNLALQIDPNYANIYNYRALLKQKQLNDLAGALSDFDRAIQIERDNAIFYRSRGLLKYSNLNDRVGAIADLQQSAKLARQQQKNQIYQRSIQILQAWGVTVEAAKF